jgi:hypothetical protein
MDSLFVRSGFIVVVLLGSSGCGDDGGGTPSDGAGADTQTDGDGDSVGGAEETQDASTDATGSGTGGATPLNGFCDAAPAYLEGCGEELDWCERAVLEACEDTFAIERDELLEARATCGFPSTCVAFDPYEQQLCVYENTQDMAPTPAQLALADDLCASCFPDDDACLDDFFFRFEPMDGVFGVSGTGASYLGYVDGFVEQLADNCVPSPGTDSCVQVYLNCLESEVMQTWPAATVDACNGGPLPPD